MAPPAKLATAVLLCASVTIIFVAVQAATSTSASSAPFTHDVPPGTSTPTRPSAAAAATRNAVPAPGAVVSEFFAAISRHDWPEVWRLGGKNLGYGPYASYSGMVSGYRGTIRDTLISIRTAGQTVSGQFRAYEAGGSVRTYEFTYIEP
jgi:hypothetical protein